MCDLAKKKTNKRHHLKTRNESPVVKSTLPNVYEVSLREN